MRSQSPAGDGCASAAADRQKASKGLGFLLEEILNSKQKGLTPAQQKDKTKNPWRYSYPGYIRVSSGRLRLRVERHCGNDRVSWTDGKRQKVEECLNAFMAMMAKAADADVKAKIAWEIAEKKRREKERLEEQLRKLRQRERRKLWALLMESACWEQSQRIGAYAGPSRQRPPDSHHRPSRMRISPRGPHGPFARLTPLTLWPLEPSVRTRTD